MKKIVIENRPFLKLIYRENFPDLKYCDFKLLKVLLLKTINPRLKLSFFQNLF